jgi:mono/diheme cytochrome c family protein
MKTPAAIGALVTTIGVIALAQARTVWDGVYSEAQAKRGEVLYAQACANCHGAELEGLDMSPALAGGAFTSNWNELTVGDLAERTRTTMPADRPATMPRAEVADVVAFLLKANRFPVGTTDLPQDTQLLKQIRIVTERPTPAH